jgi:outer membrane cobalamin receptor
MHSLGLTAGNRVGANGSVLLSLERRATDGHLQPLGRADFNDSQLDNAALFASNDFGATRVEFGALHYGWQRNNPSYLVQPGTPAASNRIGSPTARWEDGERQHFQLRIAHDFTANLVGDVTLMHHTYEEVTRFNSSYATPSGGGATAPTSNSTDASGVNATLQYSRGNNQLTVGAEYLEGDEKNRINGDSFDGQSEAVYVQDRYNLFDDRLTLFAAYRVDNFDYYAENSSSPKAGFVLRGTDDKWLLRGNTSRAFSAPSFNQLFGSFGNRALVATRFRVDELMLELHPLTGLTLEVGVFDTHETDPIFPRPRNQNPICTPGPGNCFINALDELDTKGTILSLRHQLNELFSWGASYTHLRPGNTTFATAEHVAKIDATLRSVAWQGSLFVQYEADRYFQDNFLSPFPDFTLLNLQASRTIGQHVNIKLLLENLTDEDYATTQIVSTNAAFPALPILNPGRNLSLGFTWTY